MALISIPKPNVINIEEKCKDEDHLGIVMAFEEAVEHVRQSHNIVITDDMIQETKQRLYVDYKTR